MSDRPCPSDATSREAVHVWPGMIVRPTSTLGRGLRYVVRHTNAVIYQLVGATRCEDVDALSVGSFVMNFEAENGDPLDKRPRSEAATPGPHASAIDNRTEADLERELRPAEVQIVPLARALVNALGFLPYATAAAPEDHTTLDRVIEAEDALREALDALPELALAPTMAIHPNPDSMGPRPDRTFDHRAVGAGGGDERDRDDTDCCGMCGRLFPVITFDPADGQSTRCNCDGTFQVTLFDTYLCPDPKHKDRPCAAPAVTAGAVDFDAPATAGPGAFSGSPSASSTNEPVPRAGDGQRIVFETSASAPFGSPATPPGSADSSGDDLAALRKVAEAAANYRRCPDLLPWRALEAALDALPKEKT